MAEYDYIIVGCRVGRRRACSPSVGNGDEQDPPAGGGRALVILTPRMPLSFGLLIDNPAANWLYQSEPEGQHRQPDHSGAARKTPGRLQLDQRPGLGARPTARLRHLGADGLPRLELARRRASLHPHREFRRRRRLQRPWHAGSAQGLDRARPESALRGPVQRFESSRLQDQPGLQQRGSGRRREDADLDLQGPPHERGPLLHRAGDETAEPACRHQRPHAARPARRQALRRRRV